MNRNTKRKLLAGLFVPVLGMAVGTALGQTTGSTDTSGTAAGTTASPGMGAAGTASWNAQTFDLLDKNKDGRISREEAQADPMLRDSWSKLDTGNRGSVSKDEFERYRTQSVGAGTTPGSSPPPNTGSAVPSTTSPSSGSGTTKK